MLYWCLFSVVFVIVLFLFDDSRGCIKVALYYIVCLVIIFIIINLRSCYQEPTVTDMIVIKTTREIKYGHYNPSYQCPSERTYYCVVKKDSLKKPTRQDTCVNCGQTFRRHHYKKTYEEEAWEDAVRDAILDTPAE